jgi:hypothetical protein
VSLIETVVVVGCLTMILSLCGLFLHALLRLDRAGRSALAESSSVSRLARQFRQDVREAASARPAGDRGEAGAPEIAITLADGATVRYSNEADRVIRTETAGGKTRRREGYEFRSLGPASFAVDGPTARLSLARRADPSGNEAARPGYRFEARVGKHTGLARNTDGEGRR